MVLRFVPLHQPSCGMVTRRSLQVGLGVAASSPSSRCCHCNFRRNQWIFPPSIDGAWPLLPPAFHFEFATHHRLIAACADRDRIFQQFPPPPGSPFSGQRLRRVSPPAA